MSRVFTPRQLRYKKNRLKGMSQRHAAIAAGYSEKTAITACKIERLVKSSLLDEIERAGGTDRVLAEELVSVATTSPRKVYASDKLKALEHLARLKGHLKDAPVIDASTHQNFTVVLAEASPVHRPSDDQTVLSVSLAHES